MAHDNASDRRQRRELEEIRRKFTEIGARLGSAFEPATPVVQDRPRALPAPVPPPAPPPEQPARPRWQGLAAVVLVFVLGAGLGYLLPRSGAGAQPAPTPPRPSVTTQAPPPANPAPASGAAPRACLETARRGDEVFALLTGNVPVNDRRLADAMKAYTNASQACRKEASP